MAVVDMAAPECSVDGECDDDTFCNGAERCVEGSCLSGSAPCAPGETCDEATNSCAEACVDADGDGFADVACGGIDCDDSDPNRYPGNTEICDIDDRDEDCDPRTFGYRDQDMDGRPDDACCNDGNCGTDCDDTDPTVGMDGEICDGKDNDCDTEIDNLAGGGSCSCTVNGETRDCGPSRDLDGIGICQTGTETCAGGVWVCEGAVNPASMELCNAMDDDCDGMVDETFDCVQGASTDCTVVDDQSFPGESRTCSTEGTSTCTFLCEVGTCKAATEDCDYCDDDGDGSLADELPLTTDPSETSLSAANCSEVNRRGSSASCDTETIATAGSRGSGSTNGLFFTESFTLGHGATTIEGFIEHTGLCMGGMAVSVYRDSGGGHSLGDPYGVDSAEHGIVFVVDALMTASGGRFQGSLRSIPSGPSTTSEFLETFSMGEFTNCDGFVFDLVIQPYGPSGPGGTTTYTVMTENSTQQIEGPDLYPGEQVRIGVTAFAALNTTWEASVFTVAREDVCGEGPTRGG